MSTCSGDADTVDTGSNVSVVSSNVSAGPMIALIVILDDEPKPLTAELENVISVSVCVYANLGMRGMRYWEVYFNAVKISGGIEVERN